MDFWDLTKLIFRRWKIALPLLLVTIAATTAVALTAKPDYVMTSYIQFVPAKVAPTDNPTAASLRNPWNQLGLNTLGQACIYSTQDQEFLDSLKAGGHTTSFTLTAQYPNPIIYIQVVAATAADAVATTNLVISRLRDSADALQKQSGVHDPDIIATQRLDQGQNLQPSGGKVKRALIAVLVVGLMVTAGGTVLYDAMSRRRAGRREERDKVDPLAVEIALAREAAVASTSNAKEVPLLPKVTAVRADEVPAPGNDAVTMIHPKIVIPPQAAPEEPAEQPTPAAQQPTPAAPVPVKALNAPPTPPAPAERPVNVKSTRPLKAGTYRSINAQTESADEEHGTVPVSATKSNSVPSEVRIVLQPEWVSGENGGKQR